jgi:DNA transposition AAA+ family ATPase
MSSPEFAGLRAISATATARRCALVESSPTRELIWFIQGLSLLKDGLDELAQGLLKMFPERVGTSVMHGLGTGKAKHYTAKEAHSIENQLRDDGGDCTEDLLCIEKDDYGPPVPWQMLYAECLEAAKAKLPDFLVELCINPALKFHAPGEPGSVSYWSLAEVSCFQDIIGALFEYKRRYEERVRAEFCQTAIARKVWALLDYALETKTMNVLDGLEGRGKTEAARAWCMCHLGVARFVSLVGTNTKTSHFTEFAKAFGVGHSNAHKVSQMQASVQDVLRASQLMLVIDEADFFFNQALRMKTRPEMLDWIDTALCNPPLAVVLITTPQFLICMERAVDQVKWNYRQFRRRCKRYMRLPLKNTSADIEAVARHLLPGADKATIKKIMGYEALSKRDLSAIGDVVHEAKLLAEKEGATGVAFEHVKRAIHEELIPSDVSWAEMEKRLQDPKLGREVLAEAPAPPPEADEEPVEIPMREISPLPFLETSTSRLVRSGSPIEVLAGD